MWLEYLMLGHNFSAFVFVALNVRFVNVATVKLLRNMLMYVCTVYLYLYVYYQFKMLYQTKENMYICH